MDEKDENKNRIAFFNSFEEQSEYNARIAAVKNPIEGIKETVQLILRTYGFTQETLRERKSSNEIIVDKK